MDVLSDILDVLKFKGCLYFTTNFGSPWGVKVPHYQNTARFHLVTQGSLWITVAGCPDPIKIEDGDFIIIPHGAAHEMRDNIDNSSTMLNSHDDGTFDDDGTFRLGDRESEDITRLVCGHFEFDSGFQHPLLEQLPSYILIKKEEAESVPWFNQALLVMASEAGDNKLGYSEILKRMSEILFIHTVRLWSERETGKANFIAAVTDPKIGRSLNALHAEPNCRWTVEDLAKSAGMSRTAFAEQFSKLTGLTPMQYVTVWRIQKAQRMLIENDVSVEWVASQVGYESVAAFSRVFKKIAGEGPGAYRRNNRNTPEMVH
ncbi:AraC family transcriptional regulator [Kordiimonas sp. SCSIO 12610]|uniref:AraC family transcriptional regulator n=1 Tax=Kordiimonas sp. SCSIO 12610 TaxID=2829597 RepID=UPI00210C179A|nr:AraC family transcriptional regulator [Kordiimonas sp. SCSIO 12610]UTW55904.1 AraC family transcriptional regulator [Kordiimonas sp. SCSIO 12610]